MPRGALAELLACCLKGCALGRSLGEVPPETLVLKAGNPQLWGSVSQGGETVPKTSLRRSSSLGALPSLTAVTYHSESTRREKVLRAKSRKTKHKLL